MRKCEKCEKSHKMGRKRNLLRGHYNPTPKKKKKANIQNVRVESWENGKKSSLCTQCIKTLTRKVIS
ncbi:MAG: 50S ribosomal protein L28 [Candidatus Paceibacterota bacterium]